MNSYKIPIFDLNYNSEEERAIIKTLKTRWISSGPKNIEFENMFADKLGVKYSLSTSNCTSALHLAMRILNISGDDEVICPSLTFVATVNAIRYVNATPVFCDIKSYEDLTIDPNMIKSLITKKTKAIIVMHYGGFPCDMDNIMEIARNDNLIVVEDASHSPLSEYKNKMLGTIGDIGCFSFFSNKNISTGEGGMLVTNNNIFYEKAKLLRSHGMTTLSYERSKGHSTNYDVKDLGYNYRLDDIHATLGIVQLKKIPADLEKRKKLRETYIDKLSTIENILIPFKKHTSFVSNYIFPIVLKDCNPEIREEIRNELSKKGIQTSVHYPAVHTFSIYKKYKAQLPNTDFVSRNEITLPLYSKLKLKDINYIVRELKSSLEKHF